MSYYDFDEHFWSPKTVCAQAKLTTSPNKTTNRNLLTVLSIAFMAISLGLGFKLLGVINNNNLADSSVTNSSSSNCLFFKGNAKTQVYCSQPE